MNMTTMNKFVEVEHEEKSSAYTLGREHDAALRELEQRTFLVHNRLALLRPIIVQHRRQLGGLEVRDWRFVGPKFLEVKSEN